MEKLVVTFLRGSRAGDRLEFEAAPVTFGRRPDNNVVFPDADAKVSGRHAEIVYVEGSWRVRDLGSTNGIWLGDKRLEGEREVAPVTVIELGNGGPLVRLEVIGEESWPTYRTEMAAPRPAARTELSHPRPDFAAAAPAVAAPAAAPASEHTARRSTTFFKAMIDDTVQRSNKRLRVVIITLSAVFVAAIAIVWAVLSGKTDELSEATAANQAAGRAAQSIASRYGQSVFMLIASENAKEHGFCTAFAISPDGVLATNAHCVRELKDLKVGGAKILVRMNGAPESTFEVKTWKEHPDYDGTSFSPDVAVLGVDLRGSALPVVAQLAAPEVAKALAAGQPIFTIGFPGQVMNEARPAADLRAAVVSRLTTRENTSGDAASSWVVWHSALTSKGTSGSPIFDTDGRVVAINNGGLSAREVVVEDPTTGQKRKEIISEATGLNFGIRADRLAELLHSNP